MSYRHVICLVVDGLRASALGAYGNTSYPTPNLDALARRALVADWMYADSPSLAEFYRSVWQGKHALRPAAADQASTILQQLQQAGTQQWLVSDDPWMMGQADHLPFDEALLFDNDAEHSAAEIEETTLARFFSETIERLHQWREDVADTHSLVWLHSRGMHGPWDAPFALRADMLDDEDPEPIELVVPPATLHDVEDPDELLIYRTAYAAQIAVLDACVGAFLEEVEEEFADSETLIMFAGSRGFALGEHGSIGTACMELFSEKIHVPWLLYPCGNTTPLPRLGSLSQPADIGATLVNWLIRGDAGDENSDGVSCLPLLVNESIQQQRQLAIAKSEAGELAVRTPAWMLRKLRENAEYSKESELYTKPDDRWESNDVAGLCPDVVEGLLRELECVEQCCEAGQPLPTTLRDPGLTVAER